MKIASWHFSFLVATLALLIGGSTLAAGERPNVVLVMADDVGYGDFSCHGNPVLETPHVDALYGESVRLTNFHVDPTCSPSRSALLTGKYSHRVGVWHTIAGRSLLPSEEITMAEHFADAGYDTAMFGKWHLGDNYPLRPQDQGFQYVLTHGGGGVGQTPDFWGNDYFDDTYRLNGQLTKFEGYCTDIWFDSAIAWIESHREDPFFVYLVPNAAHAPYHVAERYSKPFKEAGVPSPRAEFYGMIVNIDENVGRLRKRLDALGLADNTIFIFMTDNGSAAGARSGGFNAGMRGAKGSQYEGGHRVPCLIHWPAGGLTKGRDVESLAAHFDLLPTLADLCDVPLSNQEELDGRSLAPLLLEGKEQPPRAIIVESQRIQTPKKWRRCAVMRGPWRLVNRRKLYNLESDPDQNKDIAKNHPKIVQELQAAYNAWWAEVADDADDPTRIVIGSPEAPEVRLCVHDWHPLKENGHLRGQSSQGAIARDPVYKGYWAIEVARPGRYVFALRRRPVSHPVPIASTLASVIIWHSANKNIRSDAQVDPDKPVAIVAPTAELSAGPARLVTILKGTDGQKRGAYYVTVSRVESEP